jgi:hypothetical protein
MLKKSSGCTTGPSAAKAVDSVSLAARLKACPSETKPSWRYFHRAPKSIPFFLGLVLPVVLLAAYVLQCAWFIRTQSLTWDEPIHIISGLEMWRQGHFAHTPDHPPLGQLFATLPLARGPWHIEPAAGPEVWMKSITPDPEVMVSARAA